MFKARRLPAPDFRFSPAEEKTHPQKFHGLQKFGPYQGLKMKPTFAFVFPREYKADANALYLSLRNGLGLFKGFSNTFRVPFEKDQVIGIHEFSLKHGDRGSEAGKEYAEAIQHWVSRNQTRPDLVFVLHPRTPTWNESTPYTFCKAQLLSQGFLSQSVTLDLIRNSTQFEWSVANIALAAFVKLGGIPWAVNRQNLAQQLVLGVGRSDITEPRTRNTERFIAFTTCIQGDGIFKFSTVARASKSRAEYLISLRNIVKTAISRVEIESPETTSVTLHLPKEFSREEEEVLTDASFSTKITSIQTLKVTDEMNFFVVDDTSKDGIPSKGTWIQLSQQESLLYTEGREEKFTWLERTPSALRIKSYQPNASNLVGQTSQIFDLSQTNWRAFNARSRPVSILYSEMIARLLGHGLQIPTEHEESFSRRLWFL